MAPNNSMLSAWMSAPPPKAIIAAFTFGLGADVTPIAAPITSESAERSPQPAATIKFEPPFTGSRTIVVFIPMDGYADGCCEKSPGVHYR